MSRGDGDGAGRMMELLGEMMGEVLGFRPGDKVARDGRVGLGEVIGWARGRDGRDCLVLQMGGGGWKTYLCPVEEARVLKVPTHGDVIGELLALAGGDGEEAMARAAKALRVVESHFKGVAI